MGVIGWLIDKSAFVRLPDSPDDVVWAERTNRGMVRVCVVTMLEIGFSARNAQGVRALPVRAPISQMPVERITPSAERRAMEVQALLADRGQHRAASVPDLLIAAIAERSGLAVLHLDKDFELIAAVTGQPVERLRLGV